MDNQGQDEKPVEQPEPAAPDLEEAEDEEGAPDLPDADVEEGPDVRNDEPPEDALEGD